MAGQGPSRRELLQALGLASAASAFPGFSRWSYALGESKTQPASDPSKHSAAHSTYRPQFFSPLEYRTVEVLADLILPATPGLAHPGSQSSQSGIQAGATEAGVAEFIDFMVFSDPALQPKFRNGLHWLDHVSPTGVPFVKLTPEVQHAILERLAYASKHKDDEKEGQQFFKLFRRYTVMGFYTTRIGLEALDYPGLTFYGTSPGCTHQGNPEHIGL